jgi:hypothetical protein
MSRALGSASNSNSSRSIQAPPLTVGSICTLDHSIAPFQDAQSTSAPTGTFGTPSDHIGPGPLLLGIPVVAIALSNGLGIDYTVLDVALPYPARHRQGESRHRHRPGTHGDGSGVSQSPTPCTTSTNLRAARPAKTFTSATGAHTASCKKATSSPRASRTSEDKRTNSNNAKAVNSQPARLLPGSPCRTPP